jgi:alpha,alpha-trehalase
MIIIDVERYEAFIFDLDGVITDTASIHARAWKLVFDEFLAQQAVETGVAVAPFDVETEYRRYVDGKPRIAGVLSFLAARGIGLPTGRPGGQSKPTTAHGLASRKDRCFGELLARDSIKVFDAVPALLEEARRLGVRLAVASSSHHCAEILDAGRLTVLFDARVDGIDLDRLGLRGKPDPDMFLEAAHRLDVSPTHAAVFEDATAGIAAARAGRFGLVIGIGRGTHAAALRESGANEVVADLGEVRLRGCRIA